MIAVFVVGEGHFARTEPGRTLTNDASNAWIKPSAPQLRLKSTVRRQPRGRSWATTNCGRFRQISPAVPLISGKQESRHDNLQSDLGASDRNSRVAASAIAASSPLSYATEVPRHRHWRSLSKFPGTQISNVRRNPPSFIAGETMLFPPRNSFNQSTAVTISGRLRRPVVTTLQGRCWRGASARSYAGRFSSMSERTSASAMSAITRALTIGRGDVTSSG